MCSASSNHRPPAGNHPSPTMHLRLDLGWLHVVVVFGPDEVDVEEPENLLTWVAE